MKIKFLKDRETLKYGPVKRDQIVTVKKADGDAFIQNGVAEPVAQPKTETVDNG